MTDVYNSASGDHGNERAVISSLNVVTPFLLADASGVYSDPSQLSAYGIIGENTPKVFPPGDTSWAHPISPTALGLKLSKNWVGSNALSSASGTVVAERAGKVLVSCFFITITGATNIGGRDTGQWVVLDVVQRDGTEVFTHINNLRGGMDVTPPRATETQLSVGADATSACYEVALNPGDKASLFTELSTKTGAINFCSGSPVVAKSGQTWASTGFIVKSYFSFVWLGDTDARSHDFSASGFSEKYSQTYRSGDHPTGKGSGAISDIQTNSATDPVGVSLSDSGRIRFGGKDIANITDSGIVNIIPAEAFYYISYDDQDSDGATSDDKNFMCLFSSGSTWTETNEAGIIQIGKVSRPGNWADEEVYITAESSAIYEISLTNRIWVTGNAKYALWANGYTGTVISHMIANIDFVSCIYKGIDNIVSCGSNLSHFNPFFLDGTIGDVAQGFLFGKDLTGQPVCERTQTERYKLGKGDQLSVRRLVRKHAEYRTQFGPDDPKISRFDYEKLKWDIVLHIRRI